MSKPVFHIPLVIMSDGLIPGRDNILNITAKFDNLKFTQNVLPQSAPARVTPYWRVHQAEFRALTEGAIPLDDAIRKFQTWLERFPGKLVAVSTAPDYWHMRVALEEHGKSNPVFSGFIDLPSYSAAAEKKDMGTSPMSPVPMELIVARETAFTSAREKLENGFLTW